MAKLTTKSRNALSSSQFALPKTRSFPVPDASHARNALARAASKSPAVQSAVRAKVRAKFPTIKVKNPKGY